MDDALKSLAELSPKDKQMVVTALAKTVLDDQDVIAEEQEMLRVICALINVPLPILQSAN